MESAVIHHIAQGLAKLGLQHDDVEKLRLAAEASDKDVSNRGQERIHAALRNYRAPLINKAEWRTQLQERRIEMQQAETEKARIRSMWKTRTGNDSSHPRDLDASPIPDLKEITEKVDYKTYGLSPFVEADGRTQTKELLVYEGSLEWSSFADRCTQEVGDYDPSFPEKKKMLLSLTLEELIKEAENRGASREQLGKIILSFLRKEVPDVAMKINSHTEVTKECFKNLEGIVNIGAEITTVEKALTNVHRKPEEPSNIVGNNFQAKQKLLSRLRSSTDCGISRETTEAKIAEVTFMMMLEMISTPLKQYIINTGYRMHGNLHGDLSLRWLYKEIDKKESENPQWKITAPKYVQAKAVTVLPAEPSIFNVDGTDEAKEDDYGSDYDDPYDFDEESDDPDIVVDDETGDIFLVRGRGKPRGRRNTRGSQRRPQNPSVRRRINQVSDSSRGRGRGQSQQRGGSGQPSQGRSQTLPSDRCIRCGSFSHRHRECRRYAAFWEKACPICLKRDNSFPLFHDPALCLWAPGAQVKSNESYPQGYTGYKTPDRRSPTSSMRHGFSQNLERGGSPTTEWRSKRSKN